MDSFRSPLCGLSIVIFWFLLFCGGVESEFTSDKTCHSSFFECANLNCIKKERLCDLVDDCGDNSDELHCEDVTDKVLDCDEGFYACTHPRRCFSLTDLCGEFNECDDEVTDKLCGPFQCKSTEFKCVNDSHCIETRYVCDTAKDCVDGSDEIDCENNIHDCRKSSNYFNCDDHSKLCLHLDFACDGISQCNDGSDEKNDCYELCTEMNCDQQCIPTETGAKCACYEGYALNNDGTTCSEIDFCTQKTDDDLPPCSQKCHSAYDKAYCYCIYGYTKAEDDRSCKAKGGEAVLYYANVSEIWSLTFETKESKKLIDNRSEINGLAVDVNGNRIFWSEDGNNKAGVYSMNIDNGEDKRLILSYGLVKPSGLAFDYLAGNLYIADSDLPAIIACNLDDHFCAHVFNSSVVDSPRDIALHPKEGLMYWTEVGERPSIMKGGMNGGGSEVLVSRRIKKPVSLYLDLTVEKLFWIDSSFNEINCVNLAGSNKMVIIGHKISLPIGLVVFEDEVIWANGHTHDIMAANKFKGYDMRSLLEKVTKPTALAIGHKSLQNDMEINDCLLRHCHLCLLGPDIPSCVCSEGFVPDTNSKECKQVHSAPFLMAAVDSQIVKIDLDSEGTPMSVFKTDSLTNIFALTYLYKKHQILYAGNDEKGNVFIKRLEQIDNKPYSVPLLTDIKSIQSMAVDEAASTIFWIDSVKKSIEVSSLERTFRATLPVRANHPMSLTLNPEEGSMYFADMYPPSIKQCRLDGTKCFSLVTQQLEEPNHVLYWNHKLFWSDGSLQEISYIYPKTKERKLLVLTTNQPVSFAIYGSHLYWTEVGVKRIFYKDIAKEEGYKSHIETGYLNLVGLAAAVSPQLPQWNGCTINNGGCDHICISGQNSIACMCSNGYHLAEDGRTCTDIPACDGFLCKIEGICKESSIKCDQAEDCLDGSDEAGCPVKVNCEADEFKCDDGQCVKNLVCDRIFDCRDRSDEKPEICGKINDACSLEQFWCGFCLSRKHICDGSLDCENGEDEQDCLLDCKDDEFKCNKCIRRDWVCDGSKDCLEGEDEMNCPTNCSGFECSNKKCIDRTEVCNGFRDCDDGEDEKMGCPFTCRSDQFRCSDERCIDGNFVCDNEPDCQSGEDENPSLCLNCQANEFECSDGLCISLDKKCDGIRNCPDGLDEFNCPPPLPTECTGFRCEMGQCINQSNYCDGIMHCQDNSDETDCFLTCDRLQHCEHSCTHTLFGPRCTCKKGYHLVGKFSCKDIDECSDSHNICAQTCVNLEGAVESRGFRCECRSGFIQGSDPSFCKATGPRPYVYVSTYNNIKNLSADGHIESIAVSKTRPPIMMDIDIRLKTVYWVDEAEPIGKYRSFQQELWKKTHNKDKKSLLSGHFMDLAVDWITSNIYISHKVRSDHHITVLNEKNYQATVVSDQHHRPREMALHPSKGLMFWVSEHGHDAHLMKSSMDGTSKSIIADVLPHRKSLLALDASLDRIYWYDIYTRRMVSSDLQGISKQHFFIPDMKVHDLDVFESILYMTNFMDNSVIKFPLYGPKDKRIAHKIAHAQFPQSIRVAHLLKQPYESNPCAGKQCLYMCVLTVFGSKCVCPDGIQNTTNPQCRGSPVTSVPEVSTKQVPSGITDSPQNCSLTCHNKGQCVLEGSQQICRCLSGYIGDFCEVLMESKKQKDENSLLWIIGLVIAVVILLLLAIGAAFYIRKKRQHPDLIKAIRFKKSAKYIVTNNREDMDDAVPEISFNNPGFQDEIDEEADMQNATEWWRRLLVRSQRTVNAALNRRGSSDKCHGMNGGMPQDPTMADKVTLLKRV